MAGTFTPKVLFEGQLPNSKTTLYTVPALTKAYITSMVCTNTNTGIEDVIIYYKPGSTSRAMYSGALAASLGGGLLGGKLLVTQGDVLEAGDLIEGVTTTAAKVDCVIMGIEET